MFSTPLTSSAYALYGQAAGNGLTEAPHTTCTDRRISTIDYILYSPASLAVKVCAFNRPSQLREVMEYGRLDSTVQTLKGG